MELMTIYNLSNYENEESENLKGKLNTIEVELANFNQKAKQQIKNFRVKGILKHYENNHYSDNNEITGAE
jgi:ribosomal protein S8E